jgi:hypothetical protein
MLVSRSGGLGVTMESLWLRYGSQPRIFGVLGPWREPVSIYHGDSVTEVDTRRSRRNARGDPGRQHY